ncbi:MULTISPECIES: LacI family DNA-binding transcriptional regulator [Microbacterium]|uniref:LacI family DNA-binding transcriptional regulator n=1 Tax=Microbacterium plantarum TaxID=1816425 RepID=A0ABV5EPF9_9MICO|nr:LacI family DNA-binding transcriptional regulator [Microbacterium sp. SMR1]
MNRKRVTLAQVAAEAGVAASTASLVLAGRGSELRLSQALQERVRAAAERLGYRPNAVSVGLRTGSTRTLAFISDSVASSRLAGEMIKGAIDAARARGFLVFVGETGGDVQLERQLLNAMFDRQVDGLVLASMITHRRALPPEATRSPAVLLNLEVDGATEVPRVLPDEYAAGREAVGHLLERGHRDIHLIGAGPTEDDVPPFSLGAQQRLHGILDALTDAGVEPASGSPVIQWLPPEGFRLTSQLLDGGVVPQALICFNDRLAMGAYQALGERGLAVPDDVSVVSFDDVSFAQWLRPGLTTFALPHRAMGKRAVELLIDRVEASKDGTGAGDGAVAPSLLPMPLRVRASVREVDAAAAVPRA